MTGRIVLTMRSRESSSSSSAAKASWHSSIAICATEGLPASAKQTEEYLPPQEKIFRPYSFVCESLMSESEHRSTPSFKTKPAAIVIGFLVGNCLGTNGLGWGRG